GRGGAGAAQRADPTRDRAHGAARPPGVLVRLVPARSPPPFRLYSAPYARPAMTRRIGWIRIAMALGLVLGAGDAHAQSIFSTRGLGFPVEPQDARSSGLGGVALGFPS